MASVSRNSSAAVGCRARRRAVALGAALVVAFHAAPAAAGPFGRGVSNAAEGALIGDVIGGAPGAAIGAIAGGVIGANSGETPEDRYLAEQQAASAARLSQWEADRRQRELAAIEERERIERIAARSGGDDEALLVDTQRALYKLGYDPGTVGTRGPELVTAIVRYQESRGLLPNGEMSQDLLARLSAETDALGL
jgi:hypothetical protein